MILLVSILVPALLADGVVSYLRPWSLYMNSVFEGFYGFVRGASLASLIMLMDLSLLSIAGTMILLNNRGGGDYSQSLNRIMGVMTTAYRYSYNTPYKIIINP